MKFAKLSRFWPRMVENGEDKAKRFLNGLKVEIKKQLVLLDIKNYGVLYRLAQLIEQELIKEKIGNEAP